MKKICFSLLSILLLMTSCSNDDFNAELTDSISQEEIAQRSTQLPTIKQAWIDTGYFYWSTNIEGRLCISLTTLGRQQQYLPDVRDGEQITQAVDLFFRADKLKRAPMFNTSNIENFSGMFAYCSSLTSVPNYDTSEGVNFNSMFYDCTSLTSIPNLDTSNGGIFHRMFNGCRSLTSIPNLNTSKGGLFECMFADCRSLTSVPDLDTSNGTELRGMFASCISLKSKPNLIINKRADTYYMYNNTPFANANEYYPD